MFCMFRGPTYIDGCIVFWGFLSLDIGNIRGFQTNHAGEKARVTVSKASFGGAVVASVFHLDKNWTSLVVAR